MKREIKFRGKSRNGEWSHGDYWHDTLHDYEDSRFDEEREMVGFSEVDPDTVGQYTGFKDAEGNEVYEGDILDTKETQFSASDKVFRFVCEWYLSGMALRFIGRKYGCSESNRWMNRWPVGAENVADLVVVGNIYDNPELLKSDERPTETAE